MRLRFGDFCFDSDRRELSKRDAPIHLTPKGLQLLLLLIEQRPKVLSKEEIYEELWPGTFVEESNLSVLVAEVRGALGDDARRARFIKTSHRFGYGFVAEVQEETAAPVADVRLRSGSRDFELFDGENIVGRDADASVRINAPGISRQHARIIIR